MIDHTAAGTSYLEGAVCYYTQRIYFSDTDAGGIVYHSRYLDITEHARTEMLRLLGIEQGAAMRDHRVGYVVKSISIDYERPGLLDDLLTVRTVVTRCDRFSLVLDQRIMRGQQQLARQQTKVGHVDIGSGKPVLIPGQTRELFGQLTGGTD
ncbi:MAG: YbgC/FadM family acyl-CoA thioesterase [Spirochaetia bacterium]|nr:YbgC/FadM family acyl-CoA thioesterase [Spirochaetia bacterium]MCF7940530.1 YbgC/FadM family acyl-CoA thioesterase [Spirochaetia bacterium]